MLLSSHDEASATVLGSARALALDVSSAPRSHRQSRPRKILCAIIFWLIVDFERCQRARSVRRAGFTRGISMTANNNNNNQPS